MSLPFLFAVSVCGSVVVLLLKANTSDELGRNILPTHCSCLCWALPVIPLVWPATPNLWMEDHCMIGLEDGFKIEGPLSWGGDWHREIPGLLLRLGKSRRQNGQHLPGWKG